MKRVAFGLVALLFYASVLLLIFLLVSIPFILSNTENKNDRVTDLADFSARLIQTEH